MFEIRKTEVCDNRKVNSANTIQNGMELRINPEMIEDGRGWN
jgi:hypothetical protein